MPNVGISAPIADWVTIPELYADPFPTFERLRAEGGVHWVPAIGRYLVTSYDAVHDTELDQETFSANEDGSLMIRAMGHSMLRKDDPEHYVERRAWQPVLRPGVIKRTWTPIFERNAERYLAEFIAKGPGADLVWDFASPYVSENLRAVIGLHNATQEDLQRWSTTMIAATGNYADDPVIWAKGEASYNEVDAALDEMIRWHKKHPDDSLLSTLLRLPDYQMPIESIRANVKMTIGGGLNEPRDVIGVAAYALLQDPEQLELVRRGQHSWDDVFDEALRWVAPIGMYSRQTTRDVVLQGVHLPAGAKLGISLLSANRDDTQWHEPARFDIARTGEGAHLAFGKGVHVCLGAWAARAAVAGVALPKLFDRLAGLRIDPERPAEMGGWVFRGMTTMPVEWTPDADTERQAKAPKIAIVGAGPSGCYSAQSLRRALPDAEISVLDKMLTPFGLIRHGVAPDHQGTKEISRQFAKLFEQDDVEFIGGIEIGNDVTLDQLRASFDAVVLANGLHADAQLTIAGSDLPGVYGAGRITRLLNAHVHEARATESLGEAVAVVGHGNVAMDLVRLLAKRSEDLDGSDIDDMSHETLANDVRVIHAIGRSQPGRAKFDPVMVRELLDLDGVQHVVHGINENALGNDDPRSEIVRELLEQTPPAEPRIRVEWWFGYAPLRVDGEGSVECLEIAAAKSDTPVRVPVSSVITAIGFRADETQRLVDLDVDDTTLAETGKITDGLYAAGWARRGPQGTIPSQRTDSRQLAARIADELDPAVAKPGRKALQRELSAATNYDGWLLIDAHEQNNAAPGRVRAKISDARELRLIAGSALTIPTDVMDQVPVASTHGATGEPLTIAFGTESGNAELVAEELAARLGVRHDVRLVDLSEATVADLDPERLLLLVCSTYGDGELPTGARRIHGELLATREQLDRLEYAVFGLGDHSYTKTYSRGAEIMDEALTGLGATRTGEFGRHDAGGRELAPDVARKWAESVLTTRRTLATV